MQNFSLPLTLGEDPDDNSPCFGFVHDMVFITNPLASSCSRFEVDPAVYGLTKAQADWLIELNAALKRATEDALNAGCLAIQKALEVQSGDTAGIYFSGGASVRSLAQVFAAYAEHELRQRED